MRDAAPDGPIAYDLACAATPLPTTVEGDVSISGATVQWGNSAAGVPNVGLKAFKVMGGTAEEIYSQLTGSSGAFNTDVLPTAGQPYVGFLQTTLAGSRHTLHYPALPLVRSAINVAVPVLTTEQFAALDTGRVQNDTNNGALIVFVEDCAGIAVANATLSVTQAGAPVGAISALPGRIGAFLVLNVPAGRTTIGGRVPSAAGNVELYAHEVGVRAANGETPSGAVTITSLRPGP